LQLCKEHLPLLTAHRAAAMGPAVPNTCSKLFPCGLSGCYLATKVVKLQMLTPMRARKIYRKLEAHLMSCKKKYINLLQMKIFYTIAWNGKRNFMAPIHPKMEIRRYGVACINELPPILTKTMQ